VSSKRIRALVAIPIETGHLSTLQAIAPDWEFECIEPFPAGAVLPREQIDRCTVLVSDFAPANPESMTGLKWIQLGSAGYMQFAGLPLESMGVRITNASGVNDVPIAEWCLLMMLAFERELPELMRVQRDRAWDRRVRFQSELRGHRVGIIGYGGIGRQVARVCRAVGLEVWAINRTAIGPTPLKFAPNGTGDPEGILPHRTFTMDQMDDFLGQIDYVVLTAALNPLTRGLLGERELRLLPETAVILNPARAQLIDETALHRALRDGWIAGAAIDSHYREPLPANDPTWDLPNVILTPHISGSTLSPHREERLWELVARNIERYRAGLPLLNEIAWADLRAG
jgi:phosphoglycerate dehydrogenase-like enzyme